MTLVCDRLRAGECRVSRIVARFVVAWWKLAVSGQLVNEFLGRPKEFTGREEDFQQWSKKTVAFFAGVIMESEMMLECAAEQPDGNHDDSNSSRVLADGHECGQRSAKPGVCVAADTHSAHGSLE